MKKEFTITMAYAATGEVLASSRKLFAFDEYNLLNAWLISWKDSFIRGCFKEQDLVLQITCRVINEELRLF